MGVLFYRTLPDRGPRIVVLRGQTALAGGYYFYLPALDDECGRLVAMALSGGYRRIGNHALVGSTETWPRPAGGVFIFCGHAFSRTWFSKCLSDALYVRGRSLS